MVGHYRLPWIHDAYHAFDYHDQYENRHIVQHEPWSPCSSSLVASGIMPSCSLATRFEGFLVSWVGWLLISKISSNHGCRLSCPAHQPLHPKEIWLGRHTMQTYEAGWGARHSLKGRAIQYCRDGTGGWRHRIPQVKLFFFPPPPFGVLANSDRYDIFI
jgi:hypothetical protein